jgi:hypothetical protein
VLVGILCSSPAVVWRMLCGALTIAFGFAYIVLSFARRGTHPRPLMGASSSDDSAAPAAASPPPPPKDNLFVRGPDAPQAYPQAAPPPPSSRRNNFNPFLNVGPPEPER